MITSLIKLLEVASDRNTSSRRQRVEAKTCWQSPVSDAENSNSFVQLHFLLHQWRAWQTNGRSAIKYVWLDIEKFLALIITIIKNFLAFYPLALAMASLGFCLNLRWKSTTILTFLRWFRHHRDGLIMAENYRVEPLEADLEHLKCLLRFATLATRRCFERLSKLPMVIRPRFWCLWAILEYRAGYEVSMSQLAVKQTQKDFNQTTSGQLLRFSLRLFRVA